MNSRSIRLLTLLLMLVVVWPAMAAPQALSRSERKARLQQLSDKYQQFLLDVRPILSEEERDAFLRLESDPQRDVYITDFWHRHAPQGMSGEDFRLQYYETMKIAAKRYHRGSDRFTVSMAHGEPAEVIDPKCQQFLQPMELWRYSDLPGLGHGAMLLFYIPLHQSDYILWSPLGNVGNLETYRDLLSQQGLDEGAQAVFFSNPKDPLNSRALIDSDCLHARLLRSVIDSVALNGAAQLKALTPPKIAERPVKALLQEMVLPTPGATPLETNVSVAFPSREGNRTDARVTIFVPRAQIQKKDAKAASYTVDVTGELLHEGLMYETYRYRFDFPSDVKSDNLALVVDRLLPHGDYKFRMKIADANSKAETIVEKEIAVPDNASVTAAAESRGEVQIPFRIAPLPNGILAGLQHIEVLTPAGAVQAVAFYLDGKQVMEKRQPPYTLDLDFGDVPKLHVVRAIGLDGNGKAIAGDEITVNAGNQPFRVRIVSPRVALNVHGPTRVEMSVRVPDGRKLDKLQLFLNETPVAALYGPPFVQTVDIPRTEGVGYLRAVATLKDDPSQPPVEDLVMINSPDFMQQVNVHLVELPTTVIDHGHPVTGLPESAFKVLDEGKPVKVAKFEHVVNLPLSVGLAIDTSASMEPRMDEARQAASGFLTGVMRKDDRAFLVSFETQPQLVHGWTSDVAKIDSGLATLQAQESTSLYDAIVYSLYNFTGVGGQKALIVVTDGRDTASKFTFDQALEYARRAAVPIYAIGVDIHGIDVDVKYELGKFCQETGGNAFYIDNATDLPRIYKEIETELRSQYILGFYPGDDVKPGSAWHEVSVVVSEGKAKTIRGYYP